MTANPLRPGSISMHLHNDAPNKNRVERCMSYSSRILRRTMRFLCAFALLSFLCALLSAYVSHAHYSSSLPSFCRFTGMEPYMHATRCRVHLTSKAFVKSNIPLLDGPLPLPLYRADFPELHELQRRMTAHMLNASIFEGAVMLKFLANDVVDKTSAIYQLRKEVEERDYYLNEDFNALEDTLYIGAELGGELTMLHSNTKSNSNAA